MKRAQLTQIAADVIQIDRFLALYGSDASDARNALRELVTSLIDRIQLSREDQSRQEPQDVRSGTKDLYQALEALSPRDDEQKSLKAEALGASFEVAKIRALALAQQSTSIP